jgi:hypothetical protein
MTSSMLVNEREIDGSTVSYVERWDFSYLMDSSIKVSPSPTQTVITGLRSFRGRDSTDCR